MQMKKARNARMIFAFMVPLTLVAFWVAALTNPNLITLTNLDVYDSVSIISRLLFNDEKVQSPAFGQWIDICSFS